MVDSRLAHLDREMNEHLRTVGLSVGPVVKPAGLRPAGVAVKPAGLRRPGA